MRICDLIVISSSDFLSALDKSHRFGHGMHNGRNAMPSGNAQEVTNQLNRT